MEPAVKVILMVQLICLFVHPFFFCCPYFEQFDWSRPGFLARFWQAPGSYWPEQIDSLRPYWGQAGSRFYSTCVQRLVYSLLGQATCVCTTLDENAVALSIVLRSKYDRKRGALIFQFEGNIGFWHFVIEAEWARPFPSFSDGPYSKQKDVSKMLKFLRIRRGWGYHLYT